MLQQIENEMNAVGFVADVTVADGYVNFTINGAWFSAQVTKTGKLKKGSVRCGVAKKAPCETCSDGTKGRCAHCTKPFCGKHRFIYVDGSIEAITRNSPELCAPCHRKAYWNA